MNARLSLAAAALLLAAGTVPTVARAQAEPPAPTPATDLLAEQMGTVRGQVFNGTLDAAAPAGLVVALHSFDAHGSAPETATTLTTTTTAEGAFVFAGVPFSASRQFVVTTLFGAATYASDTLAFQPGVSELEATLRVYDSTADPSVLRVDQVHTFIEFASPEAVTVGQLYQFSNTGRAAYGAEGEARLRFSLPAGATEVSVRGGTEGQNLFASADGFELALPVAPGEATAQVLLSFNLPYTGAAGFEQTLAYPVESLNVLVTDLNVTLTSDSLQPLGVQDAMGMQFQSFEQTGLAAGERLRFSLAGEPAAPGSAETASAAPPAARPWGLIAGLGGLGAGLVAAGAWLYFRRPGPNAGASRSELLQALADLDERQDAAPMDEAAFQRERGRLKARLASQWNSEG